MRYYDLSGVWQCVIPGMEKPMTLPGTLDLSGIGYPDVGGKKWHPDTHLEMELYKAKEGIATRLTRRFTY